MRHRVHIDILSPLRRNKKISLLKGVHVYDRFYYEKLTLFWGISSFDEIAESQDVGLDEMGFDTKENPIRSRDGKKCPRMVSHVP
ncbi:hypothetical protein Gorai_023086 [Gossypium raimondii]|uniref:Uncharacterized protein n=1 Tax=Gossypium raimondii TaxID=29730 RepID=A0A7J8NV35_GOSRA|nr:hypothetical protein [Gossypium raimondii]